MITVKQYAEERGITIQAVHQSMKGKRKKDLLEGHVHTVEGVKWLDEEAVQILDEYRHKSPIVMEKEETNETIENLKLQIENLLIKTAAQADRISELAEWKAENAIALAEAGYQRQLLTEAQNKLEIFKEEKEAEISRIRVEAEEAKQAAAAEARQEGERIGKEEAQKEFEKLSIFKKIFWHR